MFLYYNINRCVQKKPASFLQAQNGEITHLYFLFFMFFYTYIRYMSFWQIFNDCDFSLFGDYNIFLIHLFYFTHHCTSVNRKVICKVGKRERKIKGVFSFFGFNVFKKSQKLAPQRLLTENVCVSKTFLWDSLMYALIIRWCLLQCFSQQAVNFEYFTKSILQFVLALR